MNVFKIILINYTFHPPVKQNNRVSSSFIYLGVARGSGWQNLGAYVNLGSYYIVGIPLAAVLAFVVHLRVKGLWIGLVSGATLQTFLFALITTFTNWHQQVSLSLFLPLFFKND